MSGSMATALGPTALASTMTRIAVRTPKSRMLVQVLLVVYLPDALGDHQPVVAERRGVFSVVEAVNEHGQSRHDSFFQDGARREGGARHSEGTPRDRLR